jgi:hypothetical protein
MPSVIFRHPTEGGIALHAASDRGNTTTHNTERRTQMCVQFVDALNTFPLDASHRSRADHIAHEFFVTNCADYATYQLASNGFHKLAPHPAHRSMFRYLELGQH